LPPGVQFLRTFVVFLCKKTDKLLATFFSAVTALVVIVSIVPCMVELAAKAPQKMSKKITVVVGPARDISSAMIPTWK
jgi:hypothetical protein